MTRYSFIIGFGLALGMGSSATSGALIDAELAGAIDFRSLDYKECLSKPSCTVDGVTIVAERRETDSDDAPWIEGRIYWDPVDGIGVRDGAQNDEIDFSERLILRFEKPRMTKKVWLSDLFHTEDKRYNSGLTDRVEGIAEDAEVAGITLQLGDVVAATVLVEAEDRLPWASFNQEIVPRFRENGDLRRRVVIDGESVDIVAPGGGGGRVTQQRFQIGKIDPEKKSIFDNVETVEIDLTEILQEFNGAQLFAVGDTNFEIIQDLTDKPDELARLQRMAQIKRDTIRMSNGEVSWTPETVIETDSITFFAPFDSSNDFSIAGIIVE